MTVKEGLHQVVDDLTDEKPDAMLRRVEPMRSDPFLRYLDSAPVDDEPVTAAEQAAIAEVESDRANGVAAGSVRRRRAQPPQ